MTAVLKQSDNEIAARNAGYTVIPGDNGDFAFAKVDRIDQQFPFWIDGFASREAAWDAAVEHAESQYATAEEQA